MFDSKFKCVTVRRKQVNHSSHFEKRFQKHFTRIGLLTVHYKKPCGYEMFRFPWPNLRISGKVNTEKKTGTLFEQQNFNCCNIMGQSIWRTLPIPHAPSLGIWNLKIGIIQIPAPPGPKLHSNALSKNIFHLMIPCVIN